MGVVRMQHFNLTLLWTSGQVPSLLTILSLSLLVTSLDCHLFPFSPPSGGSLSVEKIVSGQNPNFQQRNRVGGGGSTIGMTPFYRSVPSSRVVWSGMAGVGAGAEGGVHAWPAYQMMTKSRARAENLGNLVPEDVEDDDEHFTAEQMIQFLNNLAKENNKLSVGREIKWGV